MSLGHNLRIFSFLLIFCFLFSSSTGIVSAATYYWVGGATNYNTDNPSNWSTVAGACANSANATTPSSTDIIQFVSNCTNNAVVNTNLSVATMTMNSGYTGTVTGSGTNLTVGTTLTVYGGNLTITNGGRLTAPSGSSGFIIGGASSSTGTVTISDAGSQLIQTISGDTRVRLGNVSGSTGYLYIQNGAYASTGNIYAGYTAGGNGYVTVSGADTVWNSDVSGGLSYIGRAGTATLTISNGATVNSGATPMQIGGLSGGVGTIDISGVNSKLNLTGSNCNLRVGFSGIGTLAISNNGLLNILGTTGKLTVADQSGSVGTISIANDYSIQDLIKTTLGIFTGSGTVNLPASLPSMSLNSEIETRNDGLLRFSGLARTFLPYTISSVQYSINGNSFFGGLATDGRFNESEEEYYFDFNPTLNQPKDDHGTLIPGYTVRIKSHNNSSAVTDRLFYFTPFEINDPANNSKLTNKYPSFDFSVNRQRVNMRDSLEKYQIMVRKGRDSNNSPWIVLIDNIPIDFRSVKGSRMNNEWQTWETKDTNNGVYNTDNFNAIYSEESSRIKVYSKTSPLNGTYQWKAVAIDKSGHNQETSIRNMTIGSQHETSFNNFPLAILSITGVGNPSLNTYNLAGAKSNFSTLVTNPTFYGIAYANSSVVITLTELDCKTNCSKQYSSKADNNSRFSINISKGQLNVGKKYSVNTTVSLDNKYNELPEFQINIIGTKTSIKNTDNNSKKDEIPNSQTRVPEENVSIKPVSVSQTEDKPKSDKWCFWRFCF